MIFKASPDSLPGVGRKDLRVIEMSHTFFSSGQLREVQKGKPILFFHTLYPMCHSIVPSIVCLKCQINNNNDTTLGEYPQVARSCHSFDTFKKAAVFLCPFTEHTCRQLVKLL